MPERRRVPALLAAVAVLLLALGGPAAGQQPGPQLPSDPPATAEETRARARDILDDPAYDTPPPPDQTLLDRLREWISDHRPELRRGERERKGSQVVSFVVTGLVLVAVIVAVTWVLAGLRRTRRPAEDDLDAVVEVVPLRTAPEWEAEADRLAAAGDHRGAVRARFRGLVVALARRDLVADTPGRTAGELRDDVAERAPALAPAFAAAAGQFERAWFGGEPVGPDDSALARDLAARALAGDDR